ncbi:ectoine hydroxylase [Streptomyces sp. HNM0574]|uniref:ectoine hydroxylase n=1 Tax=Streptomyces sp. HNM0574 TaxID=2714954 RepID=UPI003217B07A
MTSVNEHLTDRYPTRGSSEVVMPRTDPVVWSEPGAPGPVGAADLARYEREGFLCVDALLTPAEVTDCRRELARLAADPGLRADGRAVVEPESDAVKSIFEPHKVSAVFDDLVRDPRVVDRARQVLGSEVYLHQFRVNMKPGFGASGWYWHSDFETWHAEDGLPAPRTLSLSLALTDNEDTNGSLMIMPGSHKTFLGCAGATPEDNYKTSLQNQGAGLPSDAAVARFAGEQGIRLCTGAAGSAVMFDSNCMHGSSDNITPFPRCNAFIVFNSVHNTTVEPFAAPARRPEYLGSRDFTPVR